MSDTSSLLQQLANKSRRFHEITGISKSKMAKAILVEPGNYSSFLNGKRGLSAESTCLLLKFVNMQPAQAVATFSRNTPSSRILKLQERGQSLRFDSSVAWTPGSATDGTDPDSTVTVDPNAPNNTIEAIIAALLKLKPADRAIVVSAIAKAVPNPSGSTAANNQRFNRRY